MTESENDDRWRAQGAISDRAPRGTRGPQRSVVPFLRPNETLRWVSRVVCAKTATGGGVGLPAALGTAIARRGSVSGSSDSIAASIPYQQHTVLGVFDNRIGLYHGLSRPVELWSAPLEVVARVNARPRLQAMARMRVHFVDDSHADFMVWRRRTIDNLSAIVRHEGLEAAP